MRRRALLHLATLAAFAPSCAKPKSPRERALGFLSDALLGDRMGLSCWVAGTSTPAPVHDVGWVFSSHFVVQAFGGELGASLSARTARKLIATRVRGAWAYSPKAPLDSDDTAFGARSLSTLSPEHASYDLSQFRWPHGAQYRTFAWGGHDEIALVPSEKANRGVHPEVNLNIAELLGGRRKDQIDLRPILELCVSQDGRVTSYFYPSPWYGTYWLLASRRAGAEVPAALAEKCRARVLDAKDRAGGWDDDPYSTALAVSALRASDEKPATYGSAIDYLRQTQRADGSWNTRQIIWSYVRQPGVIWNAFDSNRVVVTALAAQALAPPGPTANQG